MKKGISPVIAAIILIGLSITLGVLVSTWITRWAVTQTTGAAAETCVITTVYELSDATYNSTSGAISVFLINKGSDDVYDFTFELINSTAVWYKGADSPYNTTTTTISQGRSAYIKGTTVNGTTVSTLTVLNGWCKAFKPDAITVTTST